MQCTDEIQCWESNYFAALKKTSHRNTWKFKPNALIWVSSQNITIFWQHFSKPCFHLGRYVWVCPVCGTVEGAVRDGDWSCTHRMQKPDLQWLHFQLEQYEIEINLLWKCLFWLIYGDRGSFSPWNYYNWSFYLWRPIEFPSLKHGIFWLWLT